MAPYSSPEPDHCIPKVFEKNIAVHTNPNHDLKVVSVNIPEPNEGEVLVHVKATGICGR
jgi:Zn-dependent alcohol dehydrogenase